MCGRRAGFGEILRGSCRLREWVGSGMSLWGKFGKRAGGRLSRAFANCGSQTGPQGSPQGFRPLERAVATFRIQCCELVRSRFPRAAIVSEGGEMRLSEQRFVTPAPDNEEGIELIGHLDACDRYGVVALRALEGVTFERETLPDELTWPGIEAHADRLDAAAEILREGRGRSFGAFRQRPRGARVAAMAQRRRMLSMAWISPRRAVSSLRRLEILSTAEMTVVWCLPPKARPRSG